jgi:hypothetical protein
MNPAPIRTILILLMSYACGASGLDGLPLPAGSLP